MKKWILLFLPAFCLGVYLGCLLAKRTLERREKNHPACAVLYHRKTKPLSEFFSFCEKESPVRPYFHLVRNGTHWDALSPFCLPPRKMDEFLTEVKQSSPDLIPFRGPASAPFLTRYEFLPGGLFSLLRPDEWYRTGRFALGIHRPGNRVFLRWNIPDASQASAEGKSSLMSDKVAHCAADIFRLGDRIVQRKGTPIAGVFLMTGFQKEFRKTVESLRVRIGKGVFRNLNPFKRDSPEDLCSEPAASERKSPLLPSGLLAAPAGMNLIGSVIQQFPRRTFSDFTLR